MSRLTSVASFLLVTGSLSMVRLTNSRAREQHMLAPGNLPCTDQNTHCQLNVCISGKLGGVQAGTRSGSACGRQIHTTAMSSLLVCMSLMEQDATQLRQHMTVF